MNRTATRWTARLRGDFSTSREQLLAGTRPRNAAAGFTSCELTLNLIHVGEFLKRFPSSTRVLFPLFPTFGLASTKGLFSSTKIRFSRNAHRFLGFTHLSCVSLPASTFSMAAVGERRARSPTRVFFVPPSRHLLCSLCDEHFNEVVLPCAGGHTFCRECVLRWFERQRTCPECRVTIPASFTPATLPANRVVMAQVDELRVRCRFGVKEEGDGWVADEAGCPAQLTLDGAAAHEAACGFATTTCPFAGCGVALRRSDVATHNAASMQTHLDGERAARVACDARLAAFESRLSACELLSAPVARSSVVPPMLPNGWAVHHTITSASADDEDEDEVVPVYGCAFSPDSRLVCTALEGGHLKLKLFDVSSGHLRLALEGHEGHVYCCAFSPDGSTVVFGSDDNTLKLWDAASGVVIRTLEGHTEAVFSCGFSPDGRSICSASCDMSLKLWDAASGECERTLRGHENWVQCCAYSADGATVLSASDDTSLKLWSVATGFCIRTFTGHTGGVSTCCFSPADGNTILSGSGDKTLKLWDATTGVCRRTLSGHAAGVYGCAFSPIHGNLVLSCSSDRRLKLWDAATGVCTATLEGHDSIVLCCAFSPDGATICSGDTSGILKLWRRP